MEECVLVVVSRLSEGLLTPRESLLGIFLDVDAVPQSKLEVDDATVVFEDHLGVLYVLQFEAESPDENLISIAVVAVGHNAAAVVASSNELNPVELLLLDFGRGLLAELVVATKVYDLTFIVAFQVVISPNRLGLL